MFNFLKKKNLKQNINSAEEITRKEQLLIYAENIWEKEIQIGDKVIIRKDIEDGQKYGQFTFRSYMENIKV